MSLLSRALSVDEAAAELWLGQMPARRAHIEIADGLKLSANPAYIKRTKELWKRWEKECRQSIELDHDSATAMATWMATTLYPTVSKKTWKHYAYCVTASIPFDISEALNGFDPNAKGFVLKPAQRDRKGVSPASLKVIRHYLTKESSRQFGEEAADWLEATVFTGLRPREWQFASLTSDPLNPVLSTRTLKRQEVISDEGATLPKRHIPLSHCDSFALDVIQRHLQRMKTICAVGEYEAYFNKVRRVFLNARPHMPDVSGISLYSGRHQFAANLKRSEVPKGVISAVLGHSDYQTTRHHYGAKNDGVSIAFNYELAARLNNIDLS